jgi:hypothetical protein
MKIQISISKNSSSSLEKLQIVEAYQTPSEIIVLTAHTIPSDISFCTKTVLTDTREIEVDAVLPIKAYLIGGGNITAVCEGKNLDLTAQIIEPESDLSSQQIEKVLLDAGQSKPLYPEVDELLSSRIIWSFRTGLYSIFEKSLNKESYSLFNKQQKSLFENDQPTDLLYKAFSCSSKNDPFWQQKKELTSTLWVYPKNFQKYHNYLAEKQLSQSKPMSLEEVTYHFNMFFHKKSPTLFSPPQPKHEEYKTPISSPKMS